MSDNEAIEKVQSDSVKKEEEKVKIIYVHTNDPPVEKDIWTLLGEALYEADPDMWSRWAETRRKRAAAKKKKSRSKK